VLLGTIYFGALKKSPNSSLPNKITSAPVLPDVLYNTPVAPAITPQPFVSPETTSVEHWRSVFHPETWDLLLNATEHPATYGGHTFFLKALSPVFVNSLAGEFSRDVYCLDKLTFPDTKNPLVFDIGANVGFFSVLMGTLFPTATIFAFEPVELTFAFLNYNLGRNGVKNVIPFNFGLSDKTGVQKIRSILFWNQGGATLDSHHHNHQSKDWSFDTFYVQTKNLSDTMDMLQLGDRPIDFLKLDCEGCEFLAFDFETETTKRFFKRVKRLRGEIHSGVRDGKKFSAVNFTERGKQINPDLDVACLHDV
jgi:FkbM family methyltransferase